MSAIRSLVGSVESAVPNMQLTSNKVGMLWVELMMLSVLFAIELSGGLMPNELLVAATISWLAGSVMGVYVLADRGDELRISEIEWEIIRIQVFVLLGVSVVSVLWLSVSVKMAVIGSVWLPFIGLVYQDHRIK